MARYSAKSTNLGRPAGRDSDKVREDLLQAAREHFLEQEFKAVSLRMIAETAGVNGAMINYYFGSKQGLYLAMIDAMLTSMDASLQALSQNSSFTVEDFSNSYCQFLAENPWWPNFMVREVLFSDSEVREGLIRKFNASFAPKLLQSIQAEISAGNYRQDLNPGMALLSIMGMTIFPFLAKPMVEQVLNLSIDSEAAGKMAAHNTQLFMHGVLSAEPASPIEGGQS